MNYSKILLAATCISSLLFIQCSDDDDGGNSNNEELTISGGPFSFEVDGVVDNVSGIEVTNNTEAFGAESTWVVTDDENNILGLPPTIEALEGVNFDEAGEGRCLVWYLRFTEGLEGAAMGNNASDLEGTFKLSNSIVVDRLNPINIAGGPFSFEVDGTVDNVSGITVTRESDAFGTESTWVVTDDELNILGLPPTLEALEGVNFDDAGVGRCLIWYLRFTEGLEGAAMGENAADLEGTFKLSNSIVVDRLNPINIAGGPFNFDVDGTVDNVSGITVTSDSDAFGPNSTWVVTDDELNILGLPPTLEALEGVNFDDAGTGVCLIWYLRFSDGLEGAMMGENAADLEGTFMLSNSITVNRN